MRQKITYSPNLQSQASCISKAFFLWTHQLLRRGANKLQKGQYLEQTDLFDILKQERPEYTKDMFNKILWEELGKTKKQRDDKYQEFIREDQENEKLTQAQREEQKKKQSKAPSKSQKATPVQSSLYQLIQFDYWMGSIFAIFSALGQFAGPLLLKEIIKYMEDSNEPTYIGYVWCSILLVVYFLRTFLVQWGLDYINQASIKSLNALTGAIYEKIIRLSSTSQKYLDMGKLMNLINVDTQSVFMFLQMNNLFVSSPFVIGISIILICLEVGLVGLIIIVILFVAIYVQGKINQKAFMLRGQIMIESDKRAKAVSEFFGGIRIIKYYAWEEIVFKKIKDIRQRQYDMLIQNQTLRAGIDIIMTMIPSLMAVVIFGVYTAIGNQLTPSKAYMVLSLFNLILIPLRMIVMVLLVYFNAVASIRRIEHFFIAEDIEEGVLLYDTSLPVGEVIVQGGAEFCWESVEAAIHNEQGQQFVRKFGPPPGAAGKPKPGQKNAPLPPPPPPPKSPITELRKKDLRILKNIDFQSHQGELVAIIGQVGSGKSSLLHAILGEMKKVKGTVRINGRVAYIPQTAFLLNATIKNNIIFGYDYDEKKYNDALKISELTHDIEVLPGGSECEIGERGVNLSGGQKQRVSIARAIYSGADIFIIDDCLSALDAHVGKEIFFNVLKKRLKDQTVIFVTHALHFLPHTNRIVVMKDGQIVQSGTFETLSAKQDGQFSRLSSSLQKEKIDEEENEDEQDIENNGIPNSNNSPAKKVEGERESQQKEGIENNVNKANPDDSLQQVRSDVENKQDFTHFEVYPSKREQSQNKSQIKEDDQKIQKQPPQVLPKLVNPPVIALQEDQKEALPEPLGPLVKKQSSKKDSSIARKDSHATKEKQKQEQMKKLGEQQQQGELVKNEERHQGSVPFRVYKNYMLEGGKCNLFVMMTLYILTQATRQISDWWIGVWSKDTFTMPTDNYIWIYFGISIAIGIFTFLRGYQFGVFALTSSNNFQSQLLDKLLHTPLNWFDVTPTGRIIARATKDQDDLDSNLPFNLQMAILNILNLFALCIMISVLMPIFFALAVVAFYGYYKIVSYYLISSREIKRINSTIKTPIISHFQETINGTYMIRAYGKIEQYINTYMERQYHYIVVYVNENVTNRWIGIWSDIFSMVLVSGTAYFGVLSREFNYIKDPSIVGMSLTWALSISAILSFVLRTIADTENNMNSLIRILQYIEGNPSERSWKNNNVDAQAWPSSGAYDIDNITYKYRQGLPDVIHNISFQINPQEKIGVVGRTGSGKSTLTLGFLRILELSQNSDQTLGSITLDNNQIDQIGIHELREKVTIIPQDPVLFTGDIKYNIDPFNKFNDKDIAEVLKQVHLWDVLSGLQDKQDKSKQGPADKGAPTSVNESDIQKQIKITDENSIEEIQRRLSAQVDDGGSNFSLGQRQLICMARALIREPKVLLMDEATASIDEMTDHLIQSMIKVQFQDTTVITIAHRLITIIQYDRILVLDNGQIIQFDTPLNLLKKEGLFSSLINEGGEEFKKQMVNLATNKDLDVLDN